jgi:hypothetical protein
MSSPSDRSIYTARAPLYVSLVSRHRRSDSRQYDELLRNRLQAAICQHLDRRSLGLFIPALGRDERRIATEFAQFSDDLVR